MWNPASKAADTCRGSIYLVRHAARNNVSHWSIRAHSRALATRPGKRLCSPCSSVYYCSADSLCLLVCSAGRHDMQMLLYSWASLVKQPLPHRSQCHQTIIVQVRPVFDIPSKQSASSVACDTLHGQKCSTASRAAGRAASAAVPARCCCAAGLGLQGT